MADDLSGTTLEASWSGTSFLLTSAGMFHPLVSSAPSRQVDNHVNCSLPTQSGRPLRHLGSSLTVPFFDLLVLCWCSGRLFGKKLHRNFGG